MIQVELIGGLGNWLFQYAIGRVLAMKHGTRLELNACEHHLRRDSHGLSDVRMLRCFGIEAGITRIGRLRRRVMDSLLPGESGRLFRERGWGYDPAVLALGASARLFGYFQSARYWTGHEAQIRAELTPRISAGHPAPDFLDAIEGANAVSVHVRRGDYVRSELHDVCTPGYFRRAMAMMRELVPAPAFFLFSDDPAWSRAQLAGPDVMQVELPGSWRRPVLDLALMSRCRHHIISNSTFSWWGAWLDPRPGKVVLAPERWFNDEAMNRLAMQDTVPSDWRRVPVAG
ncbi:MAG: alpha-1,2-fucosyltransferase [Pseudomonadota bacterium]